MPDKDHKSPRIVVSMPEKQLDALKIFAEQTGQGMSTIARMAIAVYIKNNGGVKADVENL